MRFLLLILLLFHFVGNAQVNIDSLKTVWQNESIADSLRLDALFRISWDGFLSTYPDSTFYYANLEFDLAKKSNNKRMMANALNTMGVAKYFKGDGGSAIEYYSKAIELREEIKDTLGVAASLTNIGMIYRLQKDYAKALEYYEKGSKLEELLGDKSGEARSLNSVANIYFDLGEYEKALTNYQRSLTLSRSYADSTNVSLFMNNVGLAHLKLQQNDSAIWYFNRANNLQVLMGDLRGRVNTLNNLGVAYTEVGNYQEAITVINESLDLATANGLLIEQREASNSLYSVYKKVGDMTKALNAYELYVTLRDSILGEEKQRDVLRKEYEFQYEKEAFADSLEFAKKEAILQERTEKQSIGLVSAGITLVLLVVLAIVIFRGKKRSDELLLNILPYETAQELKRTGHSDAKLFDEVTVLFTDFKGFTALSESLSPEELVEDLNECFSAFDTIMEKNHIEKIKTIGDAYMAAGGLPRPDKNHALNVVNAALQMRDFVEAGKARKQALGQPYFEIRIGVHTGPVVAGIVGVKKFQYDIWGDTVNTASRMESSGEVGKVNISASTHQLLKDDTRFTFESRGKIQAKGKGEIEMFFITKSA